LGLKNGFYLLLGAIAFVVGTFYFWFTKNIDLILIGFWILSVFSIGYALTQQDKENKALEFK